MWVVLDTNIWRSDLGLQFDTPLAETLLAYLRQTNGRLLITDVVWREFAEHARVTYKGRLDRAQDVLSDPLLRSVLGCAPAQVPGDAVERLIDQWGATVRSRISDVLVPVPHDGDILEDVLSRAITKRRPFLGNDGGFKDAVIWTSMLRYAARVTPKVPIALLTADKGFVDDDVGGMLHPALASECSDCDVDLHLYRSIAAFLKEFAPDVRNEFGWLVARLRQPDIAGLIQEYYRIRGPYLPLEPLETFSENQIRTGVPEVLSFRVDLAEVYLVAPGESTTLALVLDVGGEIVSNTYDYRLRGERLPRGELPELPGRHRFRVVDPLQMKLELTGDAIRVLMVGDWEPTGAVFSKGDSSAMRANKLEAHSGSSERAAR